MTADDANPEETSAADEPLSPKASLSSLSTGEATSTVSDSSQQLLQMPLVLALLDGDSDVPAHFLQNGYQGGITFARRVEKAIKAQSELSICQVMLVIFFTSSPDTLKQTLLHQFLDGFNDGAKLAVAGQAQASVIKLEGFLKTFLVDQSCSTIFLGGVKSARFANTLRSFPIDVCKRKIMLITQDKPHKAFDLLSLPESQILQSLPKAAEGPFTRLNHHSAPALGLIVSPFPAAVDNGRAPELVDPFSSGPVPSPFTPTYSFPPPAVNGPPAPHDQLVMWSPGTGWSSPTDYAQSPGGTEIYRHLSIDSNCSSFFEMSGRQTTVHTASTTPLNSPPTTSPLTLLPAPLMPAPPGPPFSMGGSLPHQQQNHQLPPFQRYPPHSSPPFQQGQLMLSPMSPSSPISPHDSSVPLPPMLPPYPPQPFSQSHSHSRSPPSPRRGGLRSPMRSPPGSQGFSGPPPPFPTQGPLIGSPVAFPLDMNQLNLALVALKRKIDLTPKKGRPCNMHYRLRQCPHGNKCSLSHNFPFTPAEWHVYPHLVKQLVCRGMVNGTCKLDDSVCVFGHRCRFSKETCPFGSKCRFLIAQVPGAHGEPVATAADERAVALRPSDSSTELQPSLFHEPGDDIQEDGSIDDETQEHARSERGEDEDGATASAENSFRTAVTI